MDIKYEKLDFGSSKPYYIQIMGILEEKIRNNEFAVGNKLPPEEDLRKVFNVSLDTMREAMSKLTDAGYIVRKPSIGTVVISSEPARSTDLNRKNEIGFVICPFKTDSDLYSDPSEKTSLRIVAAEVERELRKRNLYMIYSVVDGPELSLANKEKDIAGLIVIGEVTPGILRMIKKTRMPFVLIGDIAGREIADVGTDILCVDDFQMGYSATKHLIERGHRNILYIRVREEKYSYELNTLEGYEQALKESGIARDRDLLLETKTFDLEGGYAAMKAFLDRSLPFSGIVCMGDILREGAMKALAERKTAFPEDGIVVIGERIPGIKTITQDGQALGRMAVEKLIERLTNPEWKPGRIAVPLKIYGLDKQ